jgi:hypothetical protein
MAHIAQPTRIEIEYVDKDRPGKAHPKTTTVNVTEPFPADIPFKDAIRILQNYAPEGHTVVRFERVKVHG